MIKLALFALFCLQAALAAPTTTTPTPTTTTTTFPSSTTEEECFLQSCRTSDDCCHDYGCIDGPAICAPKDMIEIWEKKAQDWDWAPLDGSDWFTTTTTTTQTTTTTTSQSTETKCQTTYDCNMLTVMTAHYHVCVSGHCVPEDKRRKRDITAQLIPAPGDGEIVPLVCEGDHCVAKDMSPSLIPAPGDGEIVPLVCEGDHCVAKDMSPSTD